MSLRVHLIHSESEWECIEQQALSSGFSNLTNFIHHRCRKEPIRLPNINETESYPKVVRTFLINDEVLEEKIKNYCKAHKIKPAALIRRIVTDPVILQCIMD